MGDLRGWFTTRLTFCAGITCAAILLAHGAGYQGAIWAVWGLTMGYVAGWSIRKEGKA